MPGELIDLGDANRKFATHARELRKDLDQFFRRVLNDKRLTTADIEQLSESVTKFFDFANVELERLNYGLRVANLAVRTDACRALIPSTDLSDRNCVERQFFALLTYFNATPPADIAHRFEFCRMIRPLLVRVQLVYADEIAPVLEHLSLCTAYIVDPEAVLDLCELVLSKNFGELFSDLAERTVTRLELASKIINSIVANPGITQITLREKLSIEKEDMREALRVMEALGMIRRTATERTARLYAGERIIARDSP